MSVDGPFGDVPCGVAPALENRGFSELTAIQRAVLDPAVAGRDLRLTSKTGSGKTVAIGFVVARQLGELAAAERQGRPVARPRALVVAPTRELAAQLEREFDWLYRPLRARLAVVTGGTNIGGDFRALARCPHLVVGTPGRLVDHVQRGSLDLGAIEAVVLDEADEMLDMGFRDDLELLLDSTPAERSTHLVSATFPRAVSRLANRYQRDAVMVEGSPVGAPNQDIIHVGLTVHDRDKVSALINVLLAARSPRTLVFVRTRAGTATLGAELCKNGFSAAILNGEMSQRERTNTLEAFRAGIIEVLVATDVAARGLDIEDVAQVVHFDKPENDEAFTHRSGRTGRAGKQGTSIVLVPPQGRARAQRTFQRLGVTVDWQRVPTSEQVRQAADERLVVELAAVEPADGNERALAERLLESHDAVQLVAALVRRSGHQGPCEPREIRDAKPPKHAPKHGADRGARGERSHSRGGVMRRGGDYTRFHVTWGAQAGANPSRLLAMVCRRGEIRSSQVGAIKVADFSSMIEIASESAADFAKAAQRRDSRNPKVRIRPWRDGKADGHDRPGFVPPRRSDRGYRRD